jgi:hypothetical protein
MHAYLPSITACFIFVLAFSPITPACLFPNVCLSASLYSIFFLSFPQSPSHASRIAYHFPTPACLPLCSLPSKTFRFPLNTCLSALKDFLPSPNAVCLHLCLFFFPPLLPRLPEKLACAPYKPTCLYSLYSPRSLPASLCLLSGVYLPLITCLPARLLVYLPRPQANLYACHPLQ